MMTAQITQIFSDEGKGEVGYIRGGHFILVPVFITVFCCTLAISLGISCFALNLLLRHCLPVEFASYPQHMLSWVSFCWMNAYCFRLAQFTHMKSHCDLL